MIHKTPYVVGFIDDHPRHRIGPQRTLMQEHGITKIYEDRALLVRQRIAGIGDVVAVTHAMLLANPVDRRKLGGLTASFYHIIDQLEDKGVTIWELSSGLKTDTKAGRDQLMRATALELTRSRARSSKLGRPRREWSQRELDIIAKHWHSPRYPTNADAIAAIKAEGVRVAVMQAYRIFGRSGRKPGDPRVRAAAEARRKDKSVVYFIQRDNRCGPIKIGTAFNAKKRIKELQTSSAHKLALLGTVPGSRVVEAKMHKRFAEYRMSGEWFQCKGRLAAYVKAKFETN